MAISRRSFLKTSAAGAAVSLASGPVSQVLAKNSSVEPGPGNKWPGRVVLNYNKDATASLKADESIVKKMVDDSIMLLTDKTTVGEAWKALIPSASAATKIAIKVPCGCAAAEMAPHWSSVKAIIEGLQQMDLGGATLPLENITIYDMNCHNNFSTCGFTAANLPGVKIVYDSLGSDSTDGARDLQYAKSLKSADYLINVFRPGGHWTQFGGFTLGFKNHYGTYFNFQKDSSVMHSTSGAQANLRDINCTGVVLKKTVLSVCVGLNGAKEMGQPQDSAVAYNNYVKATFDPSVPDPDPTKGMPPNVSPNTIMMSTDPISIEMQAVKMMRLNKKPEGKYGIADMPDYLKASGGVSGVMSDTTYNIGIIDEAQMDIRKIINGDVPVTINKSAGTAKGAASRPAIAVTHLAGMGSAFIEYRLPQSFIGLQATVEISDLKGAIVHMRRQSIAGAVSQFSWDEKTGNGQKVPAGVYVVRIVADKMQLAGKLVIPR